MVAPAVDFARNLIPCHQAIFEWLSLRSVLMMNGDAAGLKSCNTDLPLLVNSTDMLLEISSSLLSGIAMEIPSKA
jgi:hypothetical protein